MAGRNKNFNAVLLTGWLASTATGFGLLWRYETTPGVLARPSQLAWTSPNARLPLNSWQDTLVLFIHPRCPCSRATLAELADLMRDRTDRLSALAYFVRPADVLPGWEKGELWQTAAAIPGVSVACDADGRLATLWGATTSGHALLFAPDGALRFSGGLTMARGHVGDNVGCETVAALVDSSPASPRTHPALTITRPLLMETVYPQTPVYGCPLLSISTGLTARSPVCIR